jgi:hypothetical protein
MYDSAAKACDRSCMADVVGLLVSQAMAWHCLARQNRCGLPWVSLLGTGGCITSQNNYRLCFSKNKFD